MRSQTVFAIAGALFSLAAAVPMKRDVAVDTVTEVDTVVEVVTSTVWVDPTDAPAAPASSSAAATTSAAPVASSAVAQPNPVAAYQAPEHSSHSGDYQHASHAPEQSKSTPAPAPAPTSTSVAPPPPPPATTSSVYVAPPPAPTTSAYVAPPAPEPTTPTTTAAPPPATSSAAPSSNNGPSNGQKYSGDITYYDVGLGSCGQTNTDSEMVVAVAAGMMNKATMCGKSITLSYNGATQQATIVDTCPGCSGASLDLSPALFKAIAPNGDGRVHDVAWWFN